LIGLVSPFFEQRAGLTHHQARYAHYPRLFSIGVIPTRDDAQTATFHALNDANAINLFAPERGALVLDEAHSESWQDALRAMLERPRIPGASIASRKDLTSELLEAARPESLSGRPLKSAAILVGSAKTKGTSASEHMARAFVTAFSRLGVECRLHFATEFVHDSDQARAAAQSLAQADLLLLATPLYVDSLPSLATRALELVEVARRTERRDAVFVPLVNCGFPEPEHTRTALHIAKNFARAAGYAFAGALPLGAGGVVTSERSLETPRPPVSHVVRAIELTAPALAAGGPVPEAALRAILAPPLPEFLYRIAGELGFRRDSHRLGTHQRDLRAAPFGAAR
ncbi:MAG TPA: NAD(P)H-dependent oxidoreductase, partial [Polyangiaceae bacterium]|nr:NAD(P)H-dependent oxidoreductase [Polyangiaceae bacterium]